MAYQVISRKWRPGVFDDVVGQEHVVRTLTNAVDAGKVGHAYIFSGPRGVGKTTVARILAKCLNCAKGPTGTPCNECSICKSITKGSSVDTIEIDGASNNSVDNVRDLCESVRYAPTEGRHKVYIIDEVHMLSTPAFNALLKTLEEPPPNVIFIFATTEPHKIPATIHSRCQSFNFRRIPLETIHARLRSIGDSEGINIDDEALYMLIREADGSLRDAQSLLEQVLAFSEGGDITPEDVMDAIGLMDRSLVFELMEAVIDCNGQIILSIVEKAYNFGYDLKRIVLELLEQVRDVMVIKVSLGASSKKGDTLPLGLPEAELERLKGFAEKIEVARLQMLFDIFSRGYDEVVRSSTPRFSLEMMLLGTVSLGELKALTDIVSGLKGLKVTGGASSARPPVVRPPALKKNAPPDVVQSRQAPSPKVADADKATKANSDNNMDADTEVSSDKELTLDGFLEYVKNRKRFIYQSLTSGTLDFGGDKLSIAAASEKQVILGGIKADVAGLLKEYFSRDVAVEVVVKAGEAEAEAKADQEVDTKNKKLETDNEADNGKAEAKAAEVQGRVKGRLDSVTEDAMKILGGKFLEERRREDS